MYCIQMYIVLKSLVTTNIHFHSQMYQVLEVWNHPKDLYVEEDCYEVAGDWEEEYKLQRKVWKWRWMRDCVPTADLNTL